MKTKRLKINRKVDPEYERIYQKKYGDINEEIKGLKTMMEEVLGKVKKIELNTGKKEDTP